MPATQYRPYRYPTTAYTHHVAEGTAEERVNKSFRLPRALSEAFEAKALKCELTQNDLLIHLLEHYLDKY